MPILLVILPECVIADHRQPEITDSSRQPLQDSTNRRDHTSQFFAANTENRNSTAGQQQLSPASRCRAARAARLSRRRAVRPSHLTALCAARRAAAEAAAAAIAAEQRAAAAEQRRQDRARAASLHNVGRQQLDCFEEEIYQHSKLQTLTDARTKRLSIGLMRHICDFCGTKHFLCEKTGGTMAQPVFSNCCYKGKVQLPPIRRYPHYWTGLLRGNNDAGKHFRSFGCRYNQVLSMASTGADIDRSLFDGHGPPTFRIKGKISHLIRSLLPVTVPKFSQIYIHQSADAQLDTRMTVYSGMNRVMLRELQSILHSINPFVQQFKSAGEATASGNELELIIRADTGDVDCRRYNLPTVAGEVAALLPGEPMGGGCTQGCSHPAQKQPAAAHC